MHNPDAQRYFDAQKEEHGQVGKDQVILENLDDGYAIDIYDPELYESKCVLYSSELEAKEDFKALQKQCVESHLFRIPCYWQTKGHIEVRADSLDKAVAYAEKKGKEGDVSTMVGREYVDDSFELDSEAIMRMR